MDFNWVGIGTCLGINQGKMMNTFERNHVAREYRNMRKILRGNPPIDNDPIDHDKTFSLIVLIIFVILIIFLIIGCGYPTAALSQELPLTVRIAETQIGRGEIGGNNQGRFVKMYTQGQEVAWCAGFVSWVMAHSNHREGHPYFLSAKSYWKHYKNQRTNKPRPGDIICFYRGGRGSGFGHVGIVENVCGQYITTIEGNVGRYPAKVKREHYRLGHIKNLLGFIRIK